MGGDGETAAPAARRLCADERQHFIDCMYVRSKCVQSGRMSFEECLQSELSTLPEECAQLYRAYLDCRKQLVATSGQTSLISRRTPAPGSVATASIAHSSTIAEIGLAAPTRGRVRVRGRVAVRVRHSERARHTDAALWAAERLTPQDGLLKCALRTVPPGQQRTRLFQSRMGRSPRLFRGRGTGPVTRGWG